MADDIKIKLGLDVGQLFTDLSKVTTQLNQVAVSADKAETEIKQLDAQKVDIDTSGAKSALDSLASDAKSTGGGIADTFKSALNPSNLTSGIVGGLAGGLASAGIGTAISAVQGLGTAIFEGAVRADEFGDKLEVAFKQQGIADVEGEINKVRESTLQLANDLGLPTERTRELAGTVATLGGVSGKQAEDLTKLSAGIETFTDGTVKGEAVVKAFSRGLADPEGAAAIESLSKKYPQLAETLKSNISPTEKLAAANKILGTSFETVKKQQEDAGGTFNKLSNTVNEAFETIGSGLNNALNTLIPIFTESLGPAFSTLGNTISELFSRVWSVLEPILGLIGGAIMVNIVGMISVAVEALNTIYETAVYAFDQIMLALAPVFDAIKNALGMDGAVGEGVDAMGILQNVLDGVTAVIGVLFDVIGNIAKVIVDVFVAALKLAIEGVTNIVEGIKSFISFIGDLLLKIPGVSSVFKGLKSAFDDVYNFFSDLPKAINEVQVYLKAIGMTFQTVFNVLRQAFDDVLKLDFSSAGTKLAAIFDSNNWSATFSAGLQKARSEIKQTGETAKTTRKELNEIDNNNGGGGGGGGGGKGGRGKTPKETESDLQKLKTLYADYAQSLVNDDEEILATFKGTADERKAKEQELAQVRAQKLKEYLNTSLADVKDFNTVLSKEQLTLKIKPDKAKNEDFEDIRSFYLGESTKLSKDINLEIKPKVEFKVEGLKEFADQIKANQKVIVDDVKRGANEVLEFSALPTKSLIDSLAEFVDIQTGFTEAYDESLGTNENRLDAYNAKIAQINESIIAKNQVAIAKIGELQSQAAKQIAEVQAKGGANVAENVKKIEEALAAAEAPIRAYVESNINQLDELQKQSGRTIALARLQAITDVTERELRIEIQSLEFKYQDDILKAKDNAKERLKITEEYNKKKKELEDKLKNETDIITNITTALQTSILDEFNSEKIRKEKETNDAIRAERLGALDTEENDLNKSLAKREISFEDYAAKVAQIDEQRKQTEEQTETSFLDRLKTVGDKTAASVLKSQGDIFTKNAEKMEGNQKIFNEAIGQTLTSFAALAEGGKATLGDFGKAAAGVAFDAVSKMIPAFVAGILGSSITALGPIAGPIAAGLLTASLQLLLGQAKAALGFKDGVVDLAGPGNETSDSIPAWLSRGESVITAAGTRANKEELAWMNANPGMSIKDYFAMQAPAIRYSVTEDGDLIKEVRKLREETRGLGKQINRNTHVEISGVLKADNNSIKAMLESDRRRNARRG